MAPHSPFTLNSSFLTEAAAPVPERFALSTYHYHLPTDLIAQNPLEPRDSARLLILDRPTGTIQHAHVRDLPDLLSPGDLVVANRSRVLPGRLVGRKSDTGGRVELLLLRATEANTWEALVGGHRVKAGQHVEIAPGVTAIVDEATPSGRLVRFAESLDVKDILRRFGSVPLPPYIRQYHGDTGRYQTVYADVDGSAAAPTAGLHFTPGLIANLRQRGVDWTSVVLHVGLDTFKPMATEDIRTHPIHTEWVEVGETLVRKVQRAREQRGRVLAVGTTTVRALEHASASGELQPYRGPADLFITPGYRFRVVDMLLTNFHLPRSSLLLLVAAFAGRERILHAYAEAIRLRYRFLSFGDAMLIR